MSAGDGLPGGAGSRRDELGVGDRVAVALDEERPRAVDQVAFGVGVIPLVATQGDAEKSLRCGGERERDLVLDAERPVELGVDGGGAQFVLADDVGEAVRPAVAGLAGRTTRDQLLAGRTITSSGGGVERGGRRGASGGRARAAPGCRRPARGRRPRSSRRLLPRHYGCSRVRRVTSVLGPWVSMLGVTGAPPYLRGG